MILPPLVFPDQTNSCCFSYEDFQFKIRSSSRRVVMGSLVNHELDLTEIRGQCYKSFCDRNLQMFTISQSICLPQAFPAQSHVYRLLTQEWSSRKVYHSGSLWLYSQTLHLVGNFCQVQTPQLIKSTLKLKAKKRFIALTPGVSPTKVILFFVTDALSPKVCSWQNILAKARGRF